MTEPVGILEGLVDITLSAQTTNHKVESLMQLLNYINDNYAFFINDYTQHNTRLLGIIKERCTAWIEDLHDDDNNQEKIDFIQDLYNRMEIDGVQQVENEYD